MTTTAIEISGSATQALTNHVRDWSGWPNATLRFGDPDVSPVAECNHITRTVTVNLDRVLLNPNRLLRTLTPFRLRQEAVLTGSLLHESAHARFTRWKPRTAEARAALRHGDGSEVDDATLALASLMEEPRIEGRMLAESKVSKGLGWTMRAAAAHLIPPPDPAHLASAPVMEMIQFWALRAGRMIAAHHALKDPADPLPGWVWMIQQSLEASLVAHFLRIEEQTSSWPDESRAYKDTAAVVKILTSALREGLDPANDGSTFMIDMARWALQLLFPGFPETPAPQAQSGCISDAGSEGQGDDEGQGQGDDEGGEDEGEGEGEGQPPAEHLVERLARAISQMTQNQEGEDDQIAKAEAAKAEAAEAAEQTPAGGGAGTGLGNGRVAISAPKPEHREVARNAERFLKSLVDPTESSKVLVTSSPSSQVDGAALAAWRAEGKTRDPAFFRRTVRSVADAPPVQIAVLVDVSGSMDMMQDPSALLSWALSSAAYDMRNFAGRGAKISSTLIHWGTRVDVIAKNGEPLSGIATAPCTQGTTAMAEALTEVERQIPGFFTASEAPANRLLVQFTDWELGISARDRAKPLLHAGMAAGVNMLSVVPRRWDRRTYEDVVGSSPITRGINTVVAYDHNPASVWDQAVAALR